MKSFIQICVVLSFFWGSIAPASTIHVPADYPTIQAGIDAASNGDTVLVANGIYSEHIDFLGKAILLKSETGFEETIIQAANSNTPVVLFNSNETLASILHGFTIRDASGASGIEMWDASPLIKSNLIRDNHGGGGPYSEGGGIYCNNSSALIRNNVISGNSATGGGGGISIWYSSVRVDSNIVAENTCSIWGGGIRIRLANDVIVSHNLVYNNIANTGVGGIGLSEAVNAQIFNNTIDNNYAPSQGSITIWYSHDANVFNNIVTNTLSSYGVFMGGSSSGLVGYCDVYNNELGDFQGISPGVGCISTDPLYVGGFPLDYHLQASSPCIDAGDPDSPLDPDGTIADMGAFYYFAGTTTYGLSIADTYGENGQPVDVPVLAYGLESQEIAGAELHIDYDEACLEYNDISSDYLADALVNVVDGEIHILWENYLNPVMIPDSAAMLNLQFTVLGQLGDTCTIAWLDNNELVDPLGEVVEDLTFVSGNISVVEFHDISGNVVYYDLSTPVPDVTVELTGDYSASDNTDESGAYSFEDLFPGDFTICPSRSEDDAGVTVADIVLIRRHIVWLEFFDTPYKLIAADVNESGVVSVADVVKMRRYLAELDELPGGNWAFVDSSFVVTDENWPDVPACIDFTLWDADLTDSSFVGIRMGDVDYSWAQGRLGIPSPKVTDTAVLDLMNCYGQPGETVHMSINVAGFTDVAGLELHIEFPSEGMSFIGFGSDVMADPTTNGIDGEIHFVWEDIFNVVSLEDGEEVVSIAFEISEDVSDSMLVSFSTAYVVDEEGIDFGVDSRDGYVLLQQTPNYGDDFLLPESYRLSQNYPNPFNAGTVIEFDLPEQSYVAIEIYDLLGRRVEILVDHVKEAGYHQVTWDATDQPSGIYFYKIEASDFAQAKKMLLLK